GVGGHTAKGGTGPRTEDAIPRGEQLREAGGGGRTRTYEGIASGFTVRPLCRSGHSPEPHGNKAENPGRARISAATLMGRGSAGVNRKNHMVERHGAGKRRQIAILPMP